MAVSHADERTTPTGRREDARLVTGRGTYTDNQRRDGVLHCAFARSSVAHGELASVSLDGVDAPGVVGAFTAADLGLPRMPGRVPRLDHPAMARPPLAEGRVRYAGEPVAVVVAEDRTAAADGAEQVWFEVDPLPAVVGVDQAVADATLLFEDAGTNVVAVDTMGDDEVDLARWPVQVDLTVDNQRLAPLSIEPLAMLAEPDGDGGVVVTCGHQAPHRLRAQLRRLLGIEQVRVVVPDVGGAFGLKGMLFGEYVVVAALALRLGRPVRWTETRTEHFLGGTHGRGMRHRVRLAGDRSGRLRAAVIEITADVGAYPGNGAMVPTLSAWVAQGPYDLEALRVQATIAVSNAAPTGSYRGAGRPEAAYALERAVDAFAWEAGVDPIDVRRASLIRPEALPYRSRTGALYDSGDYPAALERALQLVDADGVRTAQRAAQHAAGPGGPALGLGVATFVERAGGRVDSGEWAQVTLTSDGPRALVGSCDSGQGHETVWSRVVADVFDCDPAQVTVHAGDTGLVPQGTGTFASRSAQLAGSALHRTATVVRDRVTAIAADMLEVAPADLRVRDGRVIVAGEPAGGLPLEDVIARADADGIDLTAEDDYTPHAQTFPYGAYAAVVAVDLDTGHVDLRHIVAVDDCGRVLDPQIVEGQTHGSLAQGIGQALFEELRYGADGQPRVTTLVDYHVPAAADLPAFVTDRLVTPAPSNPLGAKGSGEAGCIGGPPAVVNAALDALRPHGVTHLDMPLSPERVWRAIWGASDRATVAAEGGAAGMPGHP